MYSVHWILFHCRMERRRVQRSDKKIFRARGDFYHFHFSQSFNFLQRAPGEATSGSKVLQGETWGGGEAPIYHSFTHDCRLPACKPAAPASLTCLLLAWSTTLMLAFFLPSPVLTLCLLVASTQVFASLLASCLPSAAADTIGQFYQLALSPISSVVVMIIFINDIVPRCQISHILSVMILFFIKTTFQMLLF